MKKFVILLIALLCTSCFAADWTVNVLGNQDKDIIAGAGRTMWGNTEVGLSVCVYDNPLVSNDYDVTVGPYIATSLPIPSPFNEDVASYVGVSPQFDIEEGNPVFEVFAAGIVYPDRHVSPIILAKYNWLKDSAKAETDIEPGGALFAGLRLRF